MKDLLNNLRFSSFSHVYVEKEALKNRNTEKILSFFKTSHIIQINNYKDVFSRKNQDFIVQKKSPKLILAVKHGNLLYKGAEVCQNFGNKYFYYTSSIMNCLYNCEYCYLQGMYNSANIVVFVNLEDVFKRVEEVLDRHPIYLCVSYDTDMMAFENITGFASKWINFARSHKNLKIEMRTKSSNFGSIKNLIPCENVTLAWTLSPEKVDGKYEQNAPDLDSRIDSVQEAVSLGWKVRVCFDPILYVKNWQQIYKECIDKTFHIISGSEIENVSIGVFRVSREYFRRMKKINPHSKLLAYPFEIKNGVCTYQNVHMEKMMEFIYNTVCRYIDKDKVFI